MDPLRYPKVIDPRTEVEMLRRSLKSRDPGGVDNSDADPDTKDFDRELKSFRKYLLKQETSWVLDSSMMDFTRDVLGNCDVTSKVRLVKLFAHGALRSDFFSLFNNDRKDKFVMNYIDSFAELDTEEQKAVALLLCNASSHDHGRSYLLYFSQWTNTSSGESTCNAEVTAKAASQALKSYNPVLRCYGVGVIYNLSLKDNFRSHRENEEVLQAYKDLADYLKSSLEDFSNSALGKSSATSNGTSLPDVTAMCEKAISNLTKLDDAQPE